MRHILTTPSSIADRFRARAATFARFPQPSAVTLLDVPLRPIVEPEDAVLAPATPDEVEVPVGQQVRDRLGDGRQVFLRVRP